MCEETLSIDSSHTSVVISDLRGGRRVHPLALCLLLAHRVCSRLLQLTCCIKKLTYLVTVLPVIANSISFLVPRYCCQGYRGHMPCKIPATLIPQSQWNGKLVEQTKSSCSSQLCDLRYQ